MTIHQVFAAAEQIGSYAYLKLSTASAIMVRQLVQDAPFSTYKANKLHVTTIFSFDVMDPNEMLKNAFTGKAHAQLTKADWLGKDNCVVLHLLCPQAKACNKKWRGLGLQGTYPTYMSHMSIAQDIEKTPANIAYVQELNRMLESEVHGLLLEDEGVDFLDAKSTGN